MVTQGAPVDMETTLGVAGGTASASSIAIRAGKVYSDEITVTQSVTGEPVTLTLDGDMQLSVRSRGAWDGGYIPSQFEGVSFGVGSPMTLFEPESPQTKPGGVQALSASAGETGVALSWREPADNGGGHPIFYRIERALTPGQWEELEPGTLETSWTDPSPPESGNVFYRVTAYNAAGAGPWLGAALQLAAADPNTPATGQPTITGTAQVGETLTAETTGIADSDGLDGAIFSYQWTRNDGSTDTDVPGATGSTYDLGSDDLEKSIKARVSFEDGAGHQESLTSQSVGPVDHKVDQQQANSPATGAPSISGTAQVGETLTADTSGIADDDGLDNTRFNYQWLADDANIQGETASTYTLVTDDVGKSIKVRVSFDDNAGNAETLTSAATEAVEEVPVWWADMLVVEYTDVSIGAASADLFSNVGGSAGIQVKSLWSYTPDRDLRLEFQEGIPSTEDLTLQVGDLRLAFPAGSSGNSVFRWNDVDVDWEDGVTLAARIIRTSATESAHPNSPATGAPTISGTVQVGQTPAASTSGIVDEDGLVNVSYSYQWLADDADIQGATASTYTLVTDDVDKAIKVRVSFTDDAGNEETLTSAATAAVAKPNSPATGAPTISGTAEVGETLTASTSGIADADGLDGASYSYQWVRLDDNSETEIANIIGSTYKLGFTDLSKKVSVRVSFKDGAGNQESLTSEPVGPVDFKFSYEQSDTPIESSAVEVASDPELWTATLTVGAVSNTSRGYAHYIRPPDAGSLSPSQFFKGGLYYIVRAIYVTGEGSLRLLLNIRLPEDFVLTAGTKTFSSIHVDQEGNVGSATYGYTWHNTGLSWSVGDTIDLRLVDYFWTSTMTAGERESPGGGEGATDQGYIGNGGIGSLSPGSFDYNGDTYTVKWLYWSGSGDGSSDGVLKFAFSSGDAQTDSRIAGEALHVERFPFDHVYLGDTMFIDVFQASIRHEDLQENGVYAGYVTFEQDWLFSPRWSQGDSLTVRLAHETPGSIRRGHDNAPPNSPATGAPTISGTVQVGETLTAETSGISDDDGLAHVAYTYQWISNDGTTDTYIERATGSSYALTVPYVGKTIKVLVYFTDNAGHSERRTSAATAAVAPRPNTPATGTPTISGTAQVGETLTASTSGTDDEDGLDNAVFSYQWVRSDGTTDTDISRATGATYTLASAGRGPDRQGAGVLHRQCGLR